MNIYLQLNKLIAYLEKNLTKKIDYNYTAKILGTNLYTAEQVFKLLTGITMKEYVRNRRLSMAACDLRKGRKVIDVALDYNYTSPSAFTRSFISFHKIRPKEVKKGVSTKVFPVIHFNYNDFINKDINYQIIKNHKFIIYTQKEKFSVDHDTCLIENYWQKQKDRYPKLNNVHKRYGLSEHIKNNSKEFYYHIGLDEKWPGSSKITLSSETWLVFKNSSFKAFDITNNINNVKDIYIPSLKYYLKEKNYLEIYYDNYVELWFALK